MNKLPLILNRQGKIFNPDSNRFIAPESKEAQKLKRRLDDKAPMSVNSADEAKKLIQRIKLEQQAPPAPPAPPPKQEEIKQEPLKERDKVSVLLEQLLTKLLKEEPLSKKASQPVYGESKELRQKSKIPDEEPEKPKPKQTPNKKRMCECGKECKK